MSFWHWWIDDTYLLISFSDNQFILYHLSWKNLKIGFGENNFVYVNIINLKLNLATVQCLRIE